MIVTERIPAGVYQANCFLVFDDESKDGFIVDPAGDAPLIANRIEAAGMKPAAILLTHGHGDHIGAVEELKEQFSIPVWAHKDETALLAEPSLNLSHQMFHGPISVVPDHTFEEGDVVQGGSLSAKILHTPGHTAGCSCFWIGEELFTGDTLFAGSMGRVDLPTADPAAMAASLQRLSELPETLRIHPGHGPESSIGREKQYNPYLRGRADL